MRAICLLAAGGLLLAGCAGSALRSDCLERQQKIERTASVAASELKVGMTADQVRTLLGEPVEIVAAKGMGDFDIWKYYLFQDCRAYLGVQAPTTELFFLNGNLVKWTTMVL